MKKLLIKLLIRLTVPDDIPKDINMKRIDDWLFRQFQDNGFREYYKRRLYSLMKAMSSGVEGDRYKILFGQRVELLTLLQSVENAYQKKSKEQQKTNEITKKRSNKIIKSK